LKKSEFYIDFDVKDIGHLVALSVGHTDRPTETEAKYLKTVMKSSNFKYESNELEGVSPSPLHQPVITSSLLPKIEPSPNVIKPG
jgi:hypothetical protein